MTRSGNDGVAQLIVRPKTPENESYVKLVVRGEMSVFLCVSRWAQMYPSSGVEMGLVDSTIRRISGASLSELEHDFSDGRCWICEDFATSNAADVLLQCRLKHLNLTNYPRLKEYLHHDPVAGGVY